MVVGNSSGNVRTRGLGLLLFPCRAVATQRSKRSWRVALQTLNRMEDIKQTDGNLSMTPNGSDYQCSGASDAELDLYAQLSFWLGGKLLCFLNQIKAFIIPGGIQSVHLLRDINEIYFLALRRQWC